MARIPARASASEILDMLNKQWLGTNEIRKIASVGYQKALEIRKKLAEEARAENTFVPNGLAPSKKLIEYLNLNISHLRKMANVEDKWKKKQKIIQK